MNNKIIAMITLISLSGCSTYNADKNISKEENLSKNREIKEDVFYKTMLGNFLEYKGDDKGSVVLYRSILDQKYNKEIMYKTLENYEKNSRYLDLFELITQIEEKNIINNHPEYLFYYYVLKNMNEKAVDLIINDLDGGVYKNYNDEIEARSLKYYDYIEKINIVDNFYKNKVQDFMALLIKINKSVYITLNSNYKNESVPNLLEYKKENLSKKDFALFLIIDYYKDPKLENLTKLKEEGLDLKYYNKLIISHFNHLFDTKEYEKATLLTKFLKEHNISNSLNIDYDIFEYLGYFHTFDNNNAIYKLDIIEDKVGDNFYYYSKAILNYRLGYKNASKKYLFKVNDIKLISGNLNLYFDVMDDLSFLQENLAEIEFLNHYLSYYILKNNIEKANEVSLKIIKYMKDHNITNKALKYNLLFLKFLNNEDLGIKSAFKNYNDEKDLQSANFYTYLLSLANKDIKNGLLILKPYMNKDTNNTILDTYAWLLYKDGQYEKSLNIYKNNKMLYSEDSLIQSHISKVYFKLKDFEKFKYHDSISNQLFKR